MNTRTIEKILAELPEEEREKLIYSQLKQLTELPEHNAQRIEIIPIGELEAEIIKHHAGFGQFQGITSGYRLIDEYLTKGFVGGEMTVLAGATSNGKTAFAINMAVRIAQLGISVLFVTLEMTKKELGSRIYHVYRKPLKNLPILFQKNDELDWQDIDAIVERAKEQGAQIVFIDHLHYFTRDTEHQNEALARISKEIKKNAIRHDIPIVLLAQTRKSTNGNNTSADDISNEDISGSFAIAQDADIILFVKRSAELPDDIILKMTKNRNRGHDFNMDKFVFSFKETIITDPINDIKLDPSTTNLINYYEKETD